MTASTLERPATTEDVPRETPQCFVQKGKKLTPVTLTSGKTVGMAFAEAGVVVPAGYTPLMNSWTAEATTPVKPGAYLSFAPNLSNG